MALDGYPKSYDLNGASVTGLLSPSTNPSLYIGRNALGPGFYYTTFYLESLVLFDKFLSEALLLPIYFHYKNNGKTVIW